MVTHTRLIPIYTTSGDVAAFLLYPYIYSATGEWIGWVNANRKVYSVHGHFVGELSKDPRILRKREWTFSEPRHTPPPVPPPIRVPAHVPLARQMPEVSQNTIDVLQEAPDLMPAADYGELREDMD